MDTGILGAIVVDGLQGKGLLNIKCSNGDFFTRMDGNVIVSEILD